MALEEQDWTLIVLELQKRSLPVDVISQVCSNTYGHVVSSLDVLVENVCSKQEDKHVVHVQDSKIYSFNEFGPPTQFINPFATVQKTTPVVRD